MPEQRQPQQQKPKKLKRFLVPRQIKLMLSVLIRDLATFRLVKDQLDVTRFPDDMKHYAGVWHLVKEHYDASGTLLTDEQMRADTENWLQSAEIDDREIEDLSEMINDAFSMTKKELVKSRGTAIRYAQRFLEESVQRDLQKSVSASVAVELPALLDTAHKRVQAIQALVSGSVPVPFPDDLKTMRIIEKLATGCDFLDRYLGGGQAAGEVYGFCAPYGVCKTTLSLQLAVNRCRHEQAKWKSGGKKGGLPRVYAFFYEEEIESVRPRSLSYAATVERTIIEEGRWGDMSTKEKANYKKYERKAFAGEFDAGLIVPGEIERVQVASRMLNRNLRIVDFTGATEEYQEAAGQYVDGIVSIIDRDQALNGKPGVSMVVIDYAGAMADRHCQHRNLKLSDHLRHLIGKLPLRLKNQIAAPMRCPVWVMHQMTTEANSKKAGVVPKPTDSAEAHNFFENVNFGFMVGTKTNDQLAVLTNGKQRREGKLDDMVIKIDGLFNRVLSTGNLYRIDNSSIVLRDEFNKFADIDDEEEKAEPADGPAESEKSFGFKDLMTSRPSAYLGERRR